VPWRPPGALGGRRLDSATANDALGERLDAEVFAPRTPSDVKNLQDVAALVVLAALVLSALTTVAPARALRRLRPGSALRRP